MTVNRLTNIRKKVSNLQFKFGLLAWEVLLPFGLYWSLTRGNLPVSICFALGIVIGMVMLVVFG